MKTARPAGGPTGTAPTRPATATAAPTPASPFEPFYRQTLALAPRTLLVALTGAGWKEDPQPTLAAGPVAAGVAGWRTGVAQAARQPARYSDGTV
jgi:hypothetical protein